MITYHLKLMKKIHHSHLSRYLISAKTHVRSTELRVKHVENNTECHKTQYEFLQILFLNTQEGMLNKWVCIINLRFIYIQFIIPPQRHKGLYAT